MDKQLYNQVVQLFSSRDDVRGYCHGGIWVGKAGIDRMYVCPHRLSVLIPARVFRQYVYEGT